MQEWTVVLVLVTLSGLGVTLWRAAYSYTKTTTKLEETLNRLQDLIIDIQRDIERNANNNSESHKRIFEWLEKHDSILDDHSGKIIKLEEMEKCRKEN